ncbi:MAG: ATP-binding cassette domain-containing protein [Saprospiraceae bacterium]
MNLIESVAELNNADISIGGKLIIQDVNFSISQGEICYIIGKTGTGKSSLLKTLYAELPLTKGSGKVAGYQLENLKRNQIPMLRREIGMIFQNFELFEDWTVEYNLGFVLRATGWNDSSKRNHRIDEVLSTVGVTGKRKEKVLNVSGGEQQRIAIARALLNNPKIIIADEPTGNLDPNTSDEILYQLRDLAIKHKTAVLISTHDYRLIDKFPARVYECVDDGLKEK